MAIGDFMVEIKEEISDVNDEKNVLEVITGKDSRPHKDLLLL